MSGSLLEDIGGPLAASPGERAALLAGLRSGSIGSIGQVAAHPELRTVEALHSEIHPGGGELLRMRSETRDGSAVFLQALHCCEAGVLFLTMEGPAVSTAVQCFDLLLASITVLSPPPTAPN